MSKRILVGALGAATILSLVGVAAITASAATTSTYNFTRNLTVGSTGADVSALQQFLAQEGFFTVTPTGYFGPITKKAVAAWQASIGLPSYGFFGPESRAAIASSASVSTTSTPGCPAGALFNSMTGAPCTSAAATPGCPAGALFNSMTGAPCTTTTTTSTTSTTPATCPVGFTCTPNTTSTPTSQEGTLNLTLSGNPSTQTNIQQNIDVPVWGLQAQAQIGDVTIQRLDLDVQDQVNASPSYQENPGNFISNIKLVDGSTNQVLASYNVGLNSFVQGASSTDYYIRLSGFNFTVPNGQTKTLLVEFTTSGSIDIAHQLTITGYGTTGLQTMSGGIADYYNVSGSAFTRQQTFTKPGNTTVTFGIDASNPLSSTYYIDPNVGAQNIPVFVFNAQASNANAQLSSITITPLHNDAAGSGLAASSISLVQNGTVVASQSLNGTQAITFNNLTTDTGSTITSGTTQPYVVEVSVPNYTSGNTTVQLELNSVTYQSTTGQVYSTNPNLIGNTQYFYTASPQLAFVSGSASSGGNNQSGQTTTINGQLTFTVTPKGGQMVQPVASDFIVKVGTSLTGASVIPTASTSILSITPTPSSTSAPLSQGQAYTVTLAATANAAQLGGSGTYQFYMTSASTTVYNPNGNAVSTTQTWGLDNFKSGGVGVSQ